MPGVNDVHKLVKIWRRQLLQAAIFLVVTSSALVAQDEGRQVTIGEAVDHALEQSKLTVAGAAPFHLKAHIAAGPKAGAEYTADVEEYWLAPDKWKRMVRSRDFSQTLIANGDKVSEKLTGDYYPFWLHNLVTALFDPLPMAEQLKRMHTQLEIPEDSTKSNSCLNMQSKAGVAPIENTLAYTFCFGGKLGLLQAAVTPGFRAQFSDYQPFKNKLVARTISADFAPGVTITAKVLELAEVTNPDDSLFTVETPTAVADQMKSGQVGEGSARVLALNTPAIVWPPVREGQTSGVLSMYISTDRTGRAREAWPLGGDNPELTKAAREQLLRWQYKPYMNGGASQMEAVLTFAFSTRIENPIPMLTDAQARKLALHMEEPVILAAKPPAGTKITLRVSVNESGQVLNVVNPNNAPAPLYQAGAAALKKWRFRPYINKGKPDRFYADITLQLR